MVQCRLQWQYHDDINSSHVCQTFKLTIIQVTSSYCAQFFPPIFLSHLANQRYIFIYTYVCIYSSIIIVGYCKRYAVKHTCIHLLSYKLDSCQLLFWYNNIYHPFIHNNHRCNNGYHPCSYGHPVNTYL